MQYEFYDKEFCGKNFKNSQSVLFLGPFEIYSTMAHFVNKIFWMINMLRNSTENKSVPLERSLRAWHCGTVD